MQFEVWILVFLSAITVLMAVTFWFSPLFAKHLIGENDPFERKIFDKNLPFWQFLLLTVFVPVVIVSLTLLIFELENRGVSRGVVMDEKALMWGFLWACSLVMYGLGSHGTSVSISHYMGDNQESRAYRTVEFYHHVFSHFLIIVGLILTSAILAIWEVNHPVAHNLKYVETIVVIISGILFGISFGFVVIEGSAKYYGLPAILLVIALLTYLVINYRLDITNYPLIIYLLSGFGSSLFTLLFWRMKNGELRETMGDFFHELKN